MDGLYSYAMVLARNSDVAADLVQGYLRALKAKDRLRESRNIKSWLYTILRNIWLNQLRHQRSRPEVSDTDTEDLVQPIAGDQGKDPYTLYISKIEREQIREAIRQLPQEFRGIIVLREYEELSYQEIATILNCPPGTVMLRWRAHVPSCVTCYPRAGNWAQIAQNSFVLPKKNAPECLELVFLQNDRLERSRSPVRLTPHFPTRRSSALTGTASTRNRTSESHGSRCTHLRPVEGSVADATPCKRSHPLLC